MAVGIVQAEAVFALEAVASGLARPGLAAINVVTSPYGRFFGAWLRRGGATVHDVIAAAGQPVTLAAVSTALDGLPRADVVALVHGEAANGALNPLPEIAALARRRAALVVVDAVASVGAHRLDLDEFGIDIGVIGPQKALAGPAGLSAVTVSDRAWQRLTSPPALTASALSLVDLKRDWLDRGRGALPGTPAPLEFWALEAALDRIEAEGIDALIARHGRAAAASRAGLRALGITPWIEDDASASALVTSAPVPQGIDADRLIALAAGLGVPLGRGFGEVEGRLVRLNHTGPRAAFSPVLANVIAYGKALSALGRRVDIGAAADAVAMVYANPTA